MTSRARPTSAFREPSSLIPLRWGDPATRLWAAGWLTIGGGAVIAGSNDVALWALAMGAAAHAVGWWVAPSAGWRRLVALPLSMLGSFLLLAGPRFTFVLAIPYLCWLLVRHRPAITTLTVIPVIAVAVITGGMFEHDYSRMLPAVAAVFATMVLCAWLAGLMARLIGERRARLG
ncbi:hypothetical protein [Salinibacterium sp. ZJ77]|uniref:hypothetical protein n=1 Tax=Salinibacterium sp. ZJ77 TaxID=2708337 RepID=UPI0014226519|nr:hypothetical protein [Salinibacterium sp. ZJ77]